jgi:hypothetical protein
MNCPRCSATITTQLSKKTSLGYRVFRCKGCHRKFKERTGTVFNHLQFPTDIVLLLALWRLRYKLSLRDLSEMFLARGFKSTHEAVSELAGRRSSGSGCRIVLSIDSDFDSQPYPAQPGPSYLGGSLRRKVLRKLPDPAQPTTPDPPIALYYARNCPFICQTLCIRGLVSGLGNIVSSIKRPAPIVPQEMS